MTGLNHIKDQIIEVACYVTSPDLRLIDEKGFEEVAHCPEERLKQMDAWCTKTHQESGLWKRAVESHKTLGQIDAELLQYLQQFMGPQEGVLAGNSVHMDRLFMIKDLPTTAQFLSHRIVDVSTINEVGLRQNRGLMADLPIKRKNHTARSDIIESINELKWYYENYLVGPLHPTEQNKRDMKAFNELRKRFEKAQTMQNLNKVQLD